MVAASSSDFIIDLWTGHTADEREYPLRNRHLS